MDANRGPTKHAGGTGGQEIPGQLPPLTSSSRSTLTPAASRRVRSVEKKQKQNKNNLKNNNWNKWPEGLGTKGGMGERTKLASRSVIPSQTQESLGFSY